MFDYFHIPLNFNEITLGADVTCNRTLTDYVLLISLVSVEAAAQWESPT